VINNNTNTQSWQLQLPQNLFVNNTNATQPLFASSPSVIPQMSIEQLIANGNRIGILPQQAEPASENSMNAFLAIQAVNILSSKSHSTEDKLSAIAKLGVQAGISNEIINKVQAENIGGLIGIADTARNWSDLGNAGKVKGVAEGVNTLAQLGEYLGLGTGGFEISNTSIQDITGIVNTIDNWGQLSTSDRISGVSEGLSTVLNLGSDLFGDGAPLLGESDINGIAGIANIAANWGNLNDGQRTVGVIQGLESLSGIASTLGADLGSSALTSLAGAATGIFNVVNGVDQAGDLIGDIQEMPRSHAVGKGSLALGATGASIGAGLASTFAAFGTAFLPGVGTAIGAAVGAITGAIAGLTGSGKSTGQIMRDGWRDHLEEMGVSAKIDGSHHVPLADGSTYNIGVDGSNKLPNYGANVDGETQRYTFDVDWSNPLSAEAVPDAHIYAIATGLDPVNAKDHELFEKAVGQAHNAAISNATTQAEVKANFRAMLSNIPPEQIVGRLQQLFEASVINQEQAQVYMHHLGEIYSS